MTSPTDDWIVPTPSNPTAPHAAATDELIAGEPTPRGGLGWRTGAAIVAAGIVLGVGGVLITQQSSGDSSAASAAGPAAGAQLPGGAGQGVPGGAPFGGRDGEQHVEGTIARVGAASITVTTSSGTTTYPIAATTRILRNGAAARLSDLKVGDPVEVHVIPSTSGGAVTVEQVFAGARPSFGPGGPGRGDGGPDGGPDDGSGPGA